MYRISVLRSPSITDDRAHLKRLQRRSITSNLVASAVGLLFVVGILSVTIVYAMRFTHLYQLVKEVKYTAIIREMTSKVKFTDSVLMCDYRHVSQVDNVDSGYPPVFGNTDVLILKATLKTRTEGEAARKDPGALCKKHQESPIMEEVHETKPIKDTNTMCECKCGEHFFSVLKNSVTKHYESSPFLPAVSPDTVTVYQIDNCTLDSHSEADSLINSVTFLYHLRGIPGIPNLLDFFEDSHSVFVTVSPFLAYQLGHIKFASDEDVILAIVSGLNTLQKVHERNVVLLNSTAKSIFVQADGVYFEPSPTALMANNGVVSLSRGMVLPKTKPELTAGGTYPDSIDFYLFLSAMEVVHGLSHHIREIIIELKSAVSNNDFSQRIAASDLIFFLKKYDLNKEKIEFAVEKPLALTPYIPDHHRDCTHPVYDYLLDCFRTRSKSSKDEFAR